MTDLKNKNNNKIIIINDNENISSSFKKALGENSIGFEAYESVAKAKKHNRDKNESNIVFFNPYLKRNKKKDLIEKIKSLFPKSVFVAVYESAKETDLAEWLEKGVVSFLARSDFKKEIISNLIADLSLRFNITDDDNRKYDAFDGVLACSRDAILILVPIKKKSNITDFKIIINNLEAGIVFSHSPSELEGKKLSQFIDFKIHSDFFEKLKLVALENIKLDLEFKANISDKEKWFYARALKIKTGVILSLGDISLRRNFVKALRKTRDHSDEIENIKNKVLSEIAEEYTSDIEEIVSLSDFLKKEVHGNDIANYANYISDINSKALDLSKSFGTVSEKIKISPNKDNKQGFMDHIPHMVCLCRGNKIEKINTSGFRKLGYSSAKKIVGKNFGDFIDKDSAQKIISGFEVIAFKNKPALMTFFTKKGESFEAEVSAIRYHGEELDDKLIMVSARDVSFRKKVTENIKRVEERLAIILEKSNDAIILTNSYGKIEIFNQAAINIFGYSFKEIRGKPLSILFDESEKIMGRVFSYRGDLVKEAVCLKKGKEKFWGEVVFSEVDTASGTHIITLIRDISKLKQTEEKIAFLSTRDSLTGLVNRNSFKITVKELLEQHKSKKKFGAILVDIDKFRNIFDTMGHIVSEKVLILTAERLTEIASKKDIVARFSGDEFAVLVNNINDLNRLVEEISYTMSRPFIIDGKEIFTSASMGVLKCPDDAGSFDQMIRNLEASLRVAKSRGVNNFQLYNPEMSVNTQRRVLIETEIRKALERGEFHMLYQPKVDIASGEVRGAEALIRWKNDKLGMVSPVEFIPVAEESGYIMAIGEWVLSEVCQQIKLWQDMDISFDRIAINLSARQFMDLNLIDKISNIFKTSGVDTDHVELELTETILARNPEEAINTLMSLKDMGVQIAIDDFGMGYSSLGYLKKFPIDCLKIDREFIKDLPNDADDVAITLSIISLARHLGMKLVAEGVETLEQLLFLKDHNCDEAQGYYLSYPIEAQKITEFLGKTIRSF